VLLADRAGEHRTPAGRLGPPRRPACQGPGGVRSLTGLGRDALATFVEAVLEGPLRWAPTPPATVTGSIRWGMHVCYACETRSIVWDVDPCRMISCDRCSWWASGAELVPSAAPSAAAARLGATEPLAVWRELLSKVPSTFGCPRCAAEVPRRTCGGCSAGAPATTAPFAQSCST
jgi:hypothetical protein